MSGYYKQGFESVRITKTVAAHSVLRILKIAPDFCGELILQSFAEKIDERHTLRDDTTTSYTYYNKSVLLDPAGQQWHWHAALQLRRRRNVRQLLWGDFTFKNC